MFYATANDSTDSLRVMGEISKRNKTPTTDFFSRDNKSFEIIVNFLVSIERKRWKFFNLKKWTWKIMVDGLR